jgi:hypothetical protein
MSDLTPEARKFLERHADTGTPSAKQKSRARAGALAVLASGSAAAGVAALGTGTKIVIAVVTVAVGSAVAVPVVKWARTPAAPPAVVRVAAVQRPAPVEAVEPPAPPSPEPEPEVVPAPAAPSRAAPPRHPPVLAPEPMSPPEPETVVTPAPAPLAAAAPATPPIATDAQLAAEIALVSSAQASLRAGQPEDALRALEDHDRRFGASARMLEEVIAARIGALCALGRADAARAELEKLPKGSVYQAKLGHACW